MGNKIFVTCPRGLEQVTSEELSSILDKENTVDHGGVHLKGDFSDICKINLSSRTGMHVLQEVMSIRSTSINHLYTLIKSVIFRLPLIWIPDGGIWMHFNISITRSMPPT